VVVAAGTSAAVFAQTAEPVTITSVDIKPALLANASPEVGSQPAMGSVRVSFVNHKPIDATEVDFALYVNGSAVRKSAVIGKFSKGVTITHSWVTTVYSANQAAAITQVKFADGTVWAKS
jgi:hypothetical protein